MINSYDIETVKRISAALSKFLDAVHVPQKDFSYATMRYAQREILDALPHLKKWHEMDKDSPEWDDKEFTDAISGGEVLARGKVIFSIDDYVWTIVKCLDNLGDEQTRAVDFAEDMEKAFSKSIRILSWSGDGF